MSKIFSLDSSEICFFLNNRNFAARNKNLKNKQHKNEPMKKISLIVMSCIIACGLLANHGIVKGG